MARTSTAFMARKDSGALAQSGDDPRGLRLQSGGRRDSGYQPEFVHPVRGQEVAQQQHFPCTDRPGDFENFLR